MKPLNDSWILGTWLTHESFLMEYKYIKTWNYLDSQNMNKNMASQYIQRGNIILLLNPMFKGEK